MISTSGYFTSSTSLLHMVSIIYYVVCFFLIALSDNAVLLFIYPQYLLISFWLYCYSFQNTYFKIVFRKGFLRSYECEVIFDKASYLSGIFKQNTHFNIFIRKSKIKILLTRLYFGEDMGKLQIYIHLPGDPYMVLLGIYSN